MLVISHADEVNGYPAFTKLECDVRVFGQSSVCQQMALAYDPETGQCTNARRQPGSPQIAWLHSILCHREKLKQMLLQIRMSQEVARAGFVGTAQ